MADLGNLYFDILFRDKTAEQRKKLKAEITKDLQAKLVCFFSLLKNNLNMANLFSDDSYLMFFKRHDFSLQGSYRFYRDRKAIYNQVP